MFEDTINISTLSGCLPHVVPSDDLPEPTDNDLCGYQTTGIIVKSSFLLHVESQHSLRPFDMQQTTFFKRFGSMAAAKRIIESK